MVKFENHEQYCEALEQVFTNARRYVKVYVRQIDPKIWSDERVISAIKVFIRGYKHAQLEVIQFDSHFSQSCEFFSLTKRLSQIQILQVDEEILRIEPERNFLFADTKISLNQPQFNKLIGHYHESDRARNQNAEDSYKNIRVMAKECVDFKTVMI